MKIAGLQLDQQAAEGLRHRRWQLNITLDKCAEVLGIGVVEFRKKERGREHFSTDEIAKLSILLGSTPNALLEVIGSKAD